MGERASRIRATAGQPFRFSVNPQWNLKDIDGAEKARIVFAVTLRCPLALAFEQLVGGTRGLLADLGGLVQDRRRIGLIQ